MFEMAERYITPDQIMYFGYDRHIYEKAEALSPNHCYCRIAKCIKFYERMSLFLSELSGMQIKCFLRRTYCHQWPVQLCHIYRHYLIKDKIFRKKNFKHKICFDFPYNICLRSCSLNLRKILRNTLVIVVRSSCKL
jgi:hypothetical protein